MVGLPRGVNHRTGGARHPREVVLGAIRVRGEVERVEGGELVAAHGDNGAPQVPVRVRDRVADPAFPHGLAVDSVVKPVCVRVGLA